MTVGQPAHAVDKKEDDPQQNQDVRKNQDQRWQVAADKAEEVVVPGVPDIGKGRSGMSSCAGDSKKEHYCGHLLIVRAAYWGPPSKQYLSVFLELDAGGCGEVGRIGRDGAV